MTTIALNRLTTDVPAQWAHLPLASVRHFDWSGSAEGPCEGCGASLRTHVWRVRTAIGDVIDCGVTA